MFNNFELRRINLGNVEINFRIGGNGPPVLLLHGYPQTHVCWHLVAPTLAKSFSLVLPDLRGYGDSSCPESIAGADTYSKRSMAEDMIAMMSKLGFSNFSLIGHDRGARVGYRMALDYPAIINRMISLDVLPTLDMWDGINKGRALGAFHWTFLAQPEPLPERLITADPEFFATWLMQSWAAPNFLFRPEAMAEYIRCFSKTDVIRATCEDYRAGALVDYRLDREDFEAGRRLSCPVHFLWGTQRGSGGPMGETNPIAAWRRWSDKVTGGPVDSGHFLPEEAPDQVIFESYRFLSND